jgi:hemolysin activation/secretion protein
MHLKSYIIFKYLCKLALALSFSLSLLPLQAWAGEKELSVYPSLKVKDVKDRISPTPDIPKYCILSDSTPDTASTADTIEIKGFQFENKSGEFGPGKLVFSQEALEEVICPGTKIPFPVKITFAQLLEIRSAITNFYVKEGYITSGAYIPEATLGEGKKIRIKIVEGKLDKNNVKVSFVGKKHRLEENEIKRRFPISETLQKDRLIAYLKALQVDPDISKVDAELIPGPNTGTNTLNLSITERRQKCTFHLTLFTDESLCGVLQVSSENSRSPSVGSTGSRVKLNILPNGGSDIGFAYSRTAGSSSVDLSLIVPILPILQDSKAVNKEHRDNENKELNTISIKYNNTSNNIIEAPFSRLDINSSSQSVDMNWRISRYISPAEELALNIGVNWQQSYTSLLGVGLPLSRDDDDGGNTRVFSIRAMAEWNRRWAKSALALRGGVSIGTNVGRAESFLVLRGQGQWVRALAPDTLFLMNLNAQFSSQALPSLEQMAFGGQETLRGYRQNFLLADNGVNASMEIQVPILRTTLFGSSGTLHLIPFVDAATAWNYSRQDQLKIPSLLWSTGVGLQIRLGDQFRARVDWGTPLVKTNSNGTVLPVQNTYFSLSGTFAF